MSRHKHYKAAAPISSATVRSRAERALQEGRFQQGLELAKQLHKSEPTPEHQELVRRAYLGRARQLRGQGQTRDAATVLRAALAFDRATSAWLEQIAAELAQAGEVKEALQLAGQGPDALARISPHVVDAAIQLGAAGRAALPEALHADFDRTVQAFELTEAGRDDDARAALQAVGLRSPFLEWKLLLRGLQAYYGREDARAVENWQRLTPERLPARLAAPFRLQIDADFGAAQTPETQAVLRRQLDRLEGGVALLPQLRQVRAALANHDSLAAAFRHAEALLPTLRREAPQLVERLASCFYWAALDTGPDDVTRYKRVFGRPPADPNFYRLEALAHERAPNAEEAHSNWLKYEKEIAADGRMWPAGQANRVRALIWMRIGRNAAAVPGTEEMARLPAHLRNHPDRPRPLKPSAEECFRRCLELAPDLLEAHEALFQLQRRAKRNDKAEAAARELLKHFPEHLPTLEGLSQILLEKEEYTDALALLQRAWKANPLSRELRSQVATAHLLAARSFCLGDRFDDARREYQAALNLSDPAELYAVLGGWAAAEWRAGQKERGEELFQQAQEKAPSPLALTYLMLVESIRLKLTRPYKQRFDREFKAGLLEPPTPAAAAAMLQLTRALMKHNVRYYGQKTHAKKIA
ncbi:MAG TPA: hypothetical protein VMS17_25880, partial [Gemmataceae bacterium]|nr:hypothetical protein [Gemmataceae bacterium]